MEESEDKIDILTLSNFKTESIKKIASTNFSNGRIKFTDDAIYLLNEVLKILVCEMSVRSMKQAREDGNTSVAIGQVETVLPQILLDFP